MKRTKVFLKVVEQLKEDLTFDGSFVDPLITDEMLTRWVAETERFIKNFCAIPFVPVDLFYTWVKLAKARLLSALRGSYQLRGEDSPLVDNTIVQYVEAEYAVKFASSELASGSNSSIADTLAWLENSSIQELIPFKRLKFVGGLQRGYNHPCFPPDIDDDDDEEDDEDTP